MIVNMRTESVILALNSLQANHNAVYNEICGRILSLASNQTELNHIIHLTASIMRSTTANEAFNNIDQNIELLNQLLFEEREVFNNSIKQYLLSASTPKTAYDIINITSNFADLIVHISQSRKASEIPIALFESSENLFNFFYFESDKIQQRAPRARSASLPNLSTTQQAPPVFRPILFKTSSKVKLGTYEPQDSQSRTSILPSLPASSPQGYLSPQFVSPLARASPEPHSPRSAPSKMFMFFETIADVLTHHNLDARSSFSVTSPFEEAASSPRRVLFASPLTESTPFLEAPLTISSRVPPPLSMPRQDRTFHASDAKTKFRLLVKQIMPLQDICDEHIYEHFPNARSSENPHIKEAALHAMSIFHFIKSADIFALFTKTDTGETASISGTGAFGAPSTAQIKGYKTIYRVTENALKNGFTIEEARILGIGMFLQGSDIFYLIANHYRGFTSEAQTAQMRSIHEKAFEILTHHPDEAGTQHSFDSRTRAVGIDIIEKINEKEPFAPQVTEHMIIDSFMWAGSFSENSTLCTGTDALGCYNVFKSRAKYNVDELGYGFISLCSTKTYNYSSLSPFPQETEWVVPPGGAFNTLVFLRPKNMPVQIFIGRVVAQILNHPADMLIHGVRFQDIRENSLYFGLINFLIQYKNNLSVTYNKSDSTFENIKYYIFMWPKCEQIQRKIQDYKAKEIITNHFQMIL